MPGANVPEATFLQRDIVDAAAANDRFDAVVAFFSLLMLPRERIVEVLKDMHEMITSGVARHRHGRGRLRRCAGTVSGRTATSLRLAARPAQTDGDRRRVRR
jgi:hypothetical protein